MNDDNKLVGQDADITLVVLLENIVKQFKAAGIDSPKLDAKILIAAALEKQLSELMMFFDTIVTKEQLNRINITVEKRLSGMSVARILGRRDFWKLSFVLNEGTLEPRPDSETLVEAVLKHMSDDKSLRILDLGTGTGCLLLSVLGDMPMATGVGLDISAKAVAAARQNALANGLMKRANFINANWNNYDLSSLGKFDALISNPPYIATAEIDTLAREVKDYDPCQALDGGKDGLDAYRQIAGLLAAVLKEKGKAFFEIGRGQASAVKDIMRKNGFDVTASYNDLAGIERVLVVTKIK